MSISGCRLPSERVPVLGAGLVSVDFFCGRRHPYSRLSSPLETDPGTAAVILEKWILLSSLNCWHSDESEHLGSSDTWGPFLACLTQAQTHKLVHSAETTREGAIGLVE